MSRKQVSIYICVNRNPLLYHFCRVCEQELSHGGMMQLLKECLEHFATTGEFMTMGGISFPQSGTYEKKDSISPCLYVTKLPALLLYLDSLDKEGVSVSSMLCNILEKSVEVVETEQEKWFLDRRKPEPDVIIKPDLEKVRMLKLGNREEAVTERMVFEGDEKMRSPVKVSEPVRREKTKKKQEFVSRQAGENRKNSNPLAGLMGFVSD